MEKYVSKKRHTTAITCKGDRDYVAKVTRLARRRGMGQGEFVRIALDAAMLVLQRDVEEGRADVPKASN